jgi:prepilin-type N-terminal cleavage/methylation domain-containing protein
MRPRRGFTLIEVLIALVVMGLVTGAIYTLLNTNQRLAVAQAEQVSLQSNVRTGSLVVPNELRELNTVVGGTLPQNDILTKLPDQIQYRAMRGLGFVCIAPVANATTLVIRKSTWTGLRGPLANLDALYLFVDGNPDDDLDDAWQLVAITGVATPGNECGGGVAGYKLTVAAIPAVPINTPVRLFEVMEMKLHPDGGQWWLGARSVSGGEAMQPVLGPLTSTGFRLVYLDGAGGQTADEKNVKSVRIIVQGLTADAVRAGGFGAMGHPVDSLVSQVMLRNSIRP